MEFHIATKFISTIAMEAAVNGVRIDVISQCSDFIWNIWSRMLYVIVCALQKNAKEYQKDAEFLPILPYQTLQGERMVSVEVCSVVCQYCSYNVQRNC